MTICMLKVKMGQVNQQHCLFVKRFINKPNAKMSLAEELI